MSRHGPRIQGHHNPLADNTGTDSDRSQKETVIELMMSPIQYRTDTQIGESIFMNADRLTENEVINR